MARKSFIARVQPNRPRSKLVDWPFAVDEGEPRPRVRVKVLGAHELEAANLAAVDHFRDIKKKVAQSDPAFVAREHVELVFRAFEDEDGAPLAESAEVLSKEPSEIVQPLYEEWGAFQSEVASTRLSQSDLDELVAHVKKNTHEVPWDALPSSWLRQLLPILASQPEILPSTKESGS